MKKVILYNPKEKVKLKVPYLPFSLMTVGKALKMSGFSVKIIDGRVDKNPKNLIKSELEGDVVFFGVTLITGSVIHDALEISKFVKETKPEIKTVFGGVHSSLLPKETVKNKFVDLVVIGPGEETAVDIARNIEDGKDLSSIPDIAYENNGEVVINPKRTKSNEEFYSGVNYDMVDLKKYLKRESSGKKCLDYLSSRGCPHTCTFCAISKVWDKKMIMYSSKKMVDDIEHFVKELGIDSIHFLDDNFFVNKKRVEELCDEIKKRGIKIKIWAMCRCNYFSSYDEEFLLKLKEAGFHTINFGAESGSQRILDKIRKGIKVEEIVETAERCKKYGFRGQFSFMMAFPFEADEDLKKTMTIIDKIHSINPDFDIQLFPFTPFPQTELYFESLKYGFNPPKTLEEWSKFEYGNIVMPWLSEKKKKYIDTLTTLAWFAFTSETAIKLGFFMGGLFKLFGYIARIRWKRRNFRFPIEWKVINFLVRR